MIKVLIVDDDRLVCESLKIILQADPEIEIVGTGGSGRQGVELYERLFPDVLLMDIRMEGMTGLVKSFWHPDLTRVFCILPPFQMMTISYRR